MEAVNCWIEFLLGGRDDALAVQGDQGFLTFDARVERRADAPDACGMFGVGAWGDEEAVHGAMMVRAECEAVVWLVVACRVERNQVSGLDQGKAVVEADA